MKNNCTNCDHKMICKKYSDSERYVCSMYDPIKPRTNADRIRSMSDEELRECLYLINFNDGKYGDLTWDGWLKWLQQEVEHE